jgi:hypothetical protein
MSYSVRERLRLFLKIKKKVSKNYYYVLVQ